MKKIYILLLLATTITTQNTYCMEKVRTVLLSGEEYIVTNQPTQKIATSSEFIKEIKNIIEFVKRMAQESSNMHCKAKQKYHVNFESFKAIEFIDGSILAPEYIYMHKTKITIPYKEFVEAYNEFEKIKSKPNDEITDNLERLYNDIREMYKTFYRLHEASVRTYARIAEYGDEYYLEYEIGVAPHVDDFSLNPCECLSDCFESIVLFCTDASNDFLFKFSGLELFKWNDSTCRKQVSKVD